VVAAVEHGEVAVAALVLELMGADLRGDPFRLGSGIRTGHQPDGVALLEVAPQGLLEEVGVVAMSLLATRRMRRVER